MVELVRMGQFLFYDEPNNCTNASGTLCTYPNHVGDRSRRKEVRTKLYGYTIQSGLFYGDGT